MLKELEPALQDGPLPDVHFLMGHGSVIWPPLPSGLCIGRHFKTSPALTMTGLASNQAA